MRNAECGMRNAGLMEVIVRRLLVIVVLLFSSTWTYAQTDGMSIPIVPLSRALKAIGMTPDDLRIKSTVVDRDPWRIRCVEDLLEDPLRTPGYARCLVRRLDEVETLQERLRILAGLYIPAAEDPRLDSAIFEIPPCPQASMPPGLNPDVEKAVGILLAGMQNAQDILTEAFRDLSLPERKIACERFRKPGPQAVGLDEELLALWKRVDQGEVLIAGLVMTAAVDRARSILTAVTLDSVCALARWDTPFGPAFIGGIGPTTYAEDAALILDLGGDDRYVARAGGGSPERPVSVCVDLGGDDRYLTDDPWAQGAGAFGIGILVDCGGDDLYLASNAAQGCGAGGIGILVDGGGTDRYEGDTFVQGAGAFGIGALWDLGGPDAYRARLSAQGFGFVGAVGSLIDREGDDTYFAGGRYADFREKGRYTQSFSQGFGYGYRDRASGGAGLLMDYAGNDAYCAEYFAQGSSYWYALGLLFDGAGHDRYVARRYAQGAATHLCVAALVDEGGDDRYLSWGVSQGCGHDLAVGILLDADGDDAYVSDRLVQGAGNANGIGLLIDKQGEDRYSGEVGQSRGYGTPERTYGSIGVMMDLAGRDDYVGAGADSMLWTQGEYGVGLDQ